MAAWTLWLEQVMTRRKTYHVVTNDKGDDVFRSMSMTDCLLFLRAEDVESFLIVPAEKRFADFPFDILATEQRPAWNDVERPAGHQHRFRYGPTARLADPHTRPPR